VPFFSYNKSCFPSIYLKLFIFRCDDTQQRDTNPAQHNHTQHTDHQHHYTQSNYTQLYNSEHIDTEHNIEVMQRHKNEWHYASCHCVVAHIFQWFSVWQLYDKFVMLTSKYLECSGNFWRHSLGQFKTY